MSHSTTQLPGPYPEQPPMILWQQVWGLMVLLAAHSFAWMAYGLYQPQLLQSLGLPQLALWLGIIQGLLAACLEPVVGYLADRVLRRLGSRLPMITTGVTLAGLIFVTLALLLQVHIQTSFHWLVPLLMTIWVMAMVVFRGPVIALLKNTAPLQALPRANTALTVIFGLVGALEPLLDPLFQHLGAAVTFMLGAIALVVGASVLYFYCPPPQLFAPPPQLPLRHLPISKLLGLLLIGLGVGFAANWQLRLFPLLMTAQSPGLTTKLITSATLLIAALSAVPMEKITRRLGTQRTLLLGVAGATLIGGSLLFPLPVMVNIGLVLFSGLMFGLIFTTQIPVALQTLASHRSGLATGTLFSGIGMTTAATSLLLLQRTTPSELAGLTWAGLALLLTALGTKLIGRLA
jgi:Na+/melibiose symporter-like transporter